MRSKPVEMAESQSLGMVGERERETNAQVEDGEDVRGSLISLEWAKPRLGLTGPLLFPGPGKERKVGDGREFVFGVLYENV